MQQSVEGWPSVWQLCPSLGSVRNALVQEKSLLAFFAAGHLNLQQTAKSEVRYPSVRKAAGLATEQGHKESEMSFLWDCPTGSRRCGSSRRG